MKKQLCLLLTLLCAGSAVLSSCGESAVQPSGETPNTSTADTAAETETAEPANVIPAEYQDDLGTYDFGGRDFNFLLYGDGDPYNWSEVDVLAEAADGETINDGIYARNLSLEERLNIKITGEFNMSAPSVLNKLVQAGDATYDAAFLRISMAGSPAQSGSLLNWKDIPNVDLSKAYWDQSIMRDLSVGGKVYFTTGDISTIDNQATWTLMFNKHMVDEYDLESPYELVKSGKFTIDKFSEMTKNVSADVDGDGKYTVADRYGLTTTTDTIYGLFYSTGLTFISKDNNDMPYFDLDVEKATDVLAKTGAIFNTENRTLCAQHISASDVISAIRSVFFEDRGLFYAEVMFHVANLRQMATDFGIIPMPKYDEAQKDYITFVNPAGSCLTVPVTNEALADTGVILEAMASESYRYLTPAYYDTALKGKYARDDESAQMLDLLLQNRVYDLAMVYGWGSINSGYLSLADKNSTDLSSLVAKKKSSIETAIGKFIDAFETLNG